MQHLIISLALIKMRWVPIIFFSILLRLETNGQTFKAVPKGRESCWREISLEDSLETQIITYYPNPILCGKFPTASIAIVKLPSGDTLRVLHFCKSLKGIKEGDRLMIYPYKHFETDQVMLPADEGALTCDIRKTTDAGVLQIDQFNNASARTAANMRFGESLHPIGLAGR